MQNAQNWLQPIDSSAMPTQLEDTPTPWKRFPCPWQCNEVVWNNFQVLAMPLPGY